MTIYRLIYCVPVLLHFIIFLLFLFTCSVTSSYFSIMRCSRRYNSCMRSTFCFIIYDKTRSVWNSCQIFFHIIWDVEVNFSLFRPPSMLSCRNYNTALCGACCILHFFRISSFCVINFSFLNTLLMN